MTGKVFNTSSNIYQDQAKILFDYYKSAAETIVAAEMQEEQNMKDLVMQKNQMIDARDKAKKMSTIMFCLLITFPVGIAQLLKSKKYQQEVDRFDGLIAECNERHRNIRRDYKVEKIGVVYVPVATKAAWKTPTSSSISSISPMIFRIPFSSFPMRLKPFPLSKATARQKASTPQTTPHLYRTLHCTTIWEI